MNKWISGVLVAGLLAGLTTSANAQGTAPGGAMKVDKPFSVKIGGLFFSNSDTKDALGNSTLSLGVGYDFLKTASENPLIVQGYIDYFLPKDGTVTLGGISQETKLENMFGVGVSARYQLVRATDTASFFPYAGIGLGVYSSRVKQNTSGGEQTPTSTSDTKTGLGGKLFLGAELKQGFIGELEYNWIPSNGPVKPSGFGARIGYRF
jgi:hypothetical protein